MARTEYQIIISGSLPLEKKLTLIRKILKRADLESIIVSTSNARALGQILSFYKEQVKLITVIHKK